MSKSEIELLRKEITELKKAENLHQERHFLNEGLAHFVRLLSWDESEGLESWGERFLERLTPFMKGVQATFYTRVLNEDKLILSGAFAVEDAQSLKKTITLGEDLTGQVAKTQNRLYLTKHQDLDFQPHSSGVLIKPQALLIFPIVYEKETLGVIEILCTQELDRKYFQFVRRLNAMLGGSLKQLLREEQLQSRIQEISVDVELLSQIIETSGIGLALCNQEGIITKANSAFSRFWEEEKEYVIGKELNHFIQTEKVESDEHWIKNIVSGELTHYQETKSYDLKSGKTKWATLALRSLTTSEETNKVYLLAQVQDITEYKKEEEVSKQFNEIIEASQNEIFIFQIEGFHLLQANQCALTHLGITSDELKQKNFFDINPQFDNGDFTDLIKPLINKQKDQVRLTTLLKRKDESVYPIELNFKLSNFLGEEVLVATGIEISENKQADAQVWEQEMKLQKRLEQEVSSLSNTLEEKEKVTEEMRLYLKEKSKSVEQGIRYAQRIQRALLPSLENIEKDLPQSFVYYEPKEEVSGDFYWYSQADIQYLDGKTTLKFIATADCTGHGVPGAFMSLLGNQALDNAILHQKITEPDLILKELDTSIHRILHQDEHRDSIDLALCVIDEENKTLEFAGAKRPLLYIQNNELHSLKGEKLSVGGVELPDKNFKKYQVSFEEPTTFYMFTDGYTDQFGGPDNKKFLIPKMKKLLLEIYQLPFTEQKEKLIQNMKEWKGDNELIDDLLVIGFRLG